MTRPRDNQRARIYRAEWAAEARGMTVTPIPTVLELQAFVDRMVESRWIRSRWGKVPITVHDGRGFRKATAFNWGRLSRGGDIYMPVWSRKTWVICHEVAHILTGSYHAGHGPEFAGIFLALTEKFVDKPSADLLREAFREKKVRKSNREIPSPTKPYVSPTTIVREQRKAAAMPPRPAESQEAANVLRRAIKNGHFGAAGSKQRAHALTVARGLETL